jgi:hypothetical protein
LINLPTDKRRIKGKEEEKKGIHLFLREDIILPFIVPTPIIEKKCRKRLL